jgi:hypothetical protein
MHAGPTYLSGKVHKRPQQSVYFAPGTNHMLGKGGVNVCPIFSVALHTLA